MPLPVISGVQRVSWNWDGPTFNAVNVVHFSAPTLSESDLWDVIRSHLTDVMFEAVSDAMVLQSASIIKLDGTSGTVNITDPSPQTGGAIGTNPIPNTGPVVSVHTALRGPAHRGRVYLPGVAESRFDSGLISISDAGTMATGWTTFAAACALDDAVIGVASYVNADFEPATGFSVNRRCGTQRRRQSRVA